MTIKNLTLALFLFCVSLIPGIAQRANFFLSTSSSQIPLPSSAPDYALLSNVAAIWDATGLVANSNNSYGQVTSANNIGAAGWKSIAPGPTGRDMLPINVRGTGNLSIQMVGEVPVINSNGYASLRNTGGSANFNFLHYNATFANLKWTIHMLVRPGFGSDPGEVYGIIGNNGRTGSNKGINVTYDDRDGISISDRLNHNISKGSAGFISTSADNDKITPNVWQVLTLEFDGALTAANRMQARINGVSVPITVTSASTAVVTTPTYDLELFANGNLVAPMSGQMSHCIIQSRVESTAVRDAFIESMLPWQAYLEENKSTSVNNRLQVYNTLADDLTKYYFTVSMDQNPTAPNTLLQLYTQGTDHLPDAAKKLCYRKSTDYGTTWSAQSDIKDPVGNLCVQSCHGMYTSTGRFSVLSNEVTAGAVDWLPQYLQYTYSDDNGSTWNFVDLTSLWPSDGSTAIQTIGQGVVNNGYIMHPFFTYPKASPADITSNGVYVLRIAEGADPAGLGNWSVITIKPYGLGFISELSLAALTANDIYGIGRNEQTKEFTVYTSSDNGLLFTDRGDLPLGESFTFGGTPGNIRIYGNNVAFYYPDRPNLLLKVVYSTKAALLSDPIGGWNLSTKSTIVPDLLQGGAFVHPYGSKFAIGFSAKEPFPQTLTENKLITYYIPTVQAPN
jgi:hypothetical protein